MPSELSGLSDLTLEVIESAAERIRDPLGLPTGQIAWPLLSERCGCEVVVKHENHLPTGAFKIRGGMIYHEWLRETRPEVRGVIAATRGNHGQSVAFAARAFGFESTLVIPHGNSSEKNRAMRGYGAELIEHGRDFNEALDHAAELAENRGLHFVPSFDWELVSGVATYGLELFRAVPDLDRVYVPVGLGSGICGLIAARRALGLEDSVEIVGVVSERAPTYADSFESGRAVPGTEIPETVADGVACRVPNEDSLPEILSHVSRFVRVPEPAVFPAMRHYFTDCHQVAEGAGAIGLAAALLDGERERNAGEKIGLILSGGNVDTNVYCEALAG